MANTKPYEILAGPCRVYVSATGTDFPDIDDPESSFGTQWIRLGQTEGGVKAAHAQTIVELRTDQTTAPVKAIRSEESLEVTFSLAELTLEHYAVSLNRALEGPTVNSGNKSVQLYRGGFQVETLAMYVRGDHLSAYGDKNLAYEVPVAFQAGDPETEFVRDNKAVLACSFHVIADPDRTDDDDAFGVLRMGT
jgi:hypothetical protein